MPEDIPDAPVRLSEDEIAERASDWSDFRRDYAHPDAPIRKREHLAFLAGWDARHVSPLLTPAQQAAIDKVREMVTGGSIARLSMIEALRETAEQEADRAALAALPESHRGMVEEVRARLDQEREKATRCPSNIIHRGLRQDRCALDAGHDGPHVTEDGERWSVPIPRPIADRPQA